MGLIDRQEITGLVLAGGRGQRMGGVDKGLQLHRGVALARHALLRLGPQVGPLAISANRNLADYESMGVPVLTDAAAGFPGPLAGFVAGLAACRTPYLVTVPCDAPAFPTDLVERLAAALAADGAGIAIAATFEGQAMRGQPVFCLMRATLLASARRALDAGQRKVADWAARQGAIQVRFDDAAAFANANTLDDLHRLEGAAPHG